MSSHVFSKNEKTLKKIIDIIELLKEVRDSGGSIFSCGNGGSFAQADHFTTELVSDLRKIETRLEHIH